MPAVLDGDAGLHTLEDAHGQLGFTYAELANVLGVDESTIHRWRNHDSSPRPLARARLVQLRETMDLLRRVFAGRKLAREWIRDKRPEGLEGDTPFEVMRNGRIDRVLMLLHYLARGG